MINNSIFSVSQLNQSVRQILETQLGLVWLTGEISNFSQPVSGHWYLTLKDENAQVRCAMFRMKNMRVTFRPQNGMQVLVRASVSLYEPRGDYQLIIESMLPAGDGLLQQQFEALKTKLAAEGLFAQHLKKTLPKFCKAVGIITSPTGAALQDILQVLQRRDPSLNIVIYPCAVQGREAASEIIQMIELANSRQEVDVLIVGRGGGSLEDLYCFNEENVARAIFASQLPIISAVGHEIDVTIADFVADLRAPTPSAAAELVSRDQQQLQQQLFYQRQRLDIAFDHLWQNKQQQFQHRLLRLQKLHPKTQLAYKQQQIQQVKYRLQRAIQYHLARKKEQNSTSYQALIKSPLSSYIQRNKQYIQQLHATLLPSLCIKIQSQQGQIERTHGKLQQIMEKKLLVHNHQLGQLCSKLDSISPLKVLARGYSIALDQQNSALLSIQQISIGQNLTTRVVDGVITSQITSIKKI